MGSPWKTRIFAIIVFLILAKIWPTLAWWIVIIALGYAVLWLLYHARSLPQPIMNILDGFAKNKNATTSHSSASTQNTDQTSSQPIQQSKRDKNRRKKQFQSFRKEYLIKPLAEALIGQDVLAEEMAELVESHLAKDNPTRPASILLAGPRSSGKSDFPKHFAYVMSDVLFDNEDEIPYLQIKCTSDTHIDWDKLAEAVQDTPECVIHFDDIEKAITHGDAAASPFISGLTTIIESPAYAHAYIILTTQASASDMAQLYEREKEDIHQLNRAVRTMLTQALDQALLNRIDLVTTTAPLANSHRARIIWEMLKNMAEAEYGLELIEPQQENDMQQLQNFLLAGVDVWNDDDDGGIHEVRRWIANKSKESLVSAKRTGKKMAQARWNETSNQLLLV